GFSRSSEVGNYLRASPRLAQAATFFWYHSYVSAIPSRNPTRGFHPSPSKRELSSSLRGVPSGFVVSKASSPLNPTTSQIVSASSRIVTSSPYPHFKISRASHCA